MADDLEQADVVDEGEGAIAATSWVGFREVKSSGVGSQVVPVLLLDVLLNLLAVSMDPVLLLLVLEPFLPGPAFGEIEGLFFRVMRNEVLSVS